MTRLWVRETFCNKTFFIRANFSSKKFAPLRRTFITVFDTDCSSQDRMTRTQSVTNRFPHALSAAIDISDKSDWSFRGLMETHESRICCYPKNQTTAPIIENSLPTELSDTYFDVMWCIHSYKVKWKLKYKAKFEFEWMLCIVQSQVRTQV